MSPQRIQLRRTKGWRKQPGAIVVARPTKWGNHYRISPTMSRAEAVENYRRWLGTRGHPEGDIVAELRGHDLACWCPLEDSAGRRMPCHADVLLELANPEVVFPWSM